MGAGARSKGGGVTSNGLGPAPVATGGEAQKCDQLGSSITCEDTKRATANQDDPNLRAAWRAVANAKLVEYRRQTWRLSMLVRQGVVDKAAAVDKLYEIATAHALVRALGEDRVEAIIAEAFT
jgi:hypothetical protein